MALIQNKPLINVLNAKWNLVNIWRRKAKIEGDFVSPEEYHLKVESGKLKCLKLQFYHVCKSRIFLRVVHQDKNWLLFSVSMLNEKKKQHHQLATGPPISR